MYSRTYLTKLNILIQVILQATKSIVASVMGTLQLFAATIQLTQIIELGDMDLFNMGLVSGNLVVAPKKEEGIHQ